MNNAIYLAANRYFFTGILEDGQPASNASIFSGMTNAEIQEAVLIHELLHLAGIAGSDSENQTIVLGNGQAVQGSTGISQAVKDNCFR